MRRAYHAVMTPATVADPFEEGCTGAALRQTTASPSLNPSSTFIDGYPELTSPFCPPNSATAASAQVPQQHTSMGAISGQALSDLTSSSASGSGLSSASSLASSSAAPSAFQKQMAVPAAPSQPEPSSSQIEVSRTRGGGLMRRLSLALRAFYTGKSKRAASAIPQVCLDLHASQMSNFHRKFDSLLPSQMCTSCEPNSCRLTVRLNASLCCLLDSITNCMVLK